MPADSRTTGQTENLDRRGPARTTREVGAWIARECGIEYQTRSGLIALLHRLDMEHRKPVERSSFPNWDGAEQRRAFTVKGDELIYTSPGSTGTATQVVMRRVK